MGKLIAYRGSRIDEWYKVYAQYLAMCAITYPQEYHTTGLTLDEVAKKAIDIANTTKYVLQTKGITGINVDTPAWQQTAAHFHILNTQLSWQEFFSGR